MSNGVLVTAAHGRSYKTIEAAKFDWDRHYDFQLPNGFYVSKRQEKEAKSLYGTLYIRIEGNIEELV